MKFSTQVFTRLLDAALMCGLVFGSADVKVFAFWMVSIMAALMFAGLFAITPELAEKIQGRSSLKKAFGILVNSLYVAALIYAGYPILAVLYAVISLLIRLSAESKLAPKVSQ